ncbi:hypothetical protein RUM43_004868 [Polyplax serrata]|uniref:Uncharacterized protein n=1 Tax=Polyplax serrata TaxID=468196 RepID=A0AAN8SBA9_POLSC
MERSEKLKVIDEELLSFYQYCQNAGFSQSEMEVICAPLTTALRQNNMRRNLKLFALVGIFLVCVYTASEVHSVNTHFTALGRLLMIKMLPIWDWTTMFYETCLISNPMYKGYSLQKEDCLTCETLDRVERISEVSFNRLLDDYLVRDRPVIVVDAMTYWPVMNTHHFYFENITQTYLKNEKLMDTVPCVLISNIRPGSNDLLAFLKRLQSPTLDKWFVHWQNCDINAVKALRKFYQRPYFLSTSVAPAHFNWVLMSSDYNTKVYKQVELDSGLIILAQLRGSTDFKLTPNSPCNGTCPELSGSLHEGEMLVFTNFMWSFEYRPENQTDNVAILTETIWEDNAI